MTDPSPSLELATVDEIVEELGKRHTAVLPVAE